VQENIIYLRKRQAPRVVKTCGVFFAGALFAGQFRRGALRRRILRFAGKIPFL